MKDFDHKVAAVTGAASGIGRALALELAGQGAHVAICDVDERGLEQTAGDVAALGAKVSCARVDVAHREAVHEWADRIAEEFGTVNLVFNNAAKFAVRGYTECLREELEVAGQPVSATCVHPGGIRTNIVRNGRLAQIPGGLSQDEAVDEFERAARTSPQKAAQQILNGVRRNKRRVLVGPDARVIDIVQRLIPTAYQRLVAAAVKRRQSIEGK